jgi:hypothetical protein
MPPNHAMLVMTISEAYSASPAHLSLLKARKEENPQRADGGNSSDRGIYSQKIEQMSNYLPNEGEKK